MTDLFETVKDITLEEDYIGNAAYRKEIKKGLTYTQARRAGHEAIREHRKLKNTQEVGGGTNKTRVID